jgi:hypothetical protein
VAGSNELKRGSDVLATAGDTRLKARRMTAVDEEVRVTAGRIVQRPLFLSQITNPHISRI